jgi:hypothetical protein
MNHEPAVVDDEYLATMNEVETLSAQSKKSYAHRLYTLRKLMADANGAMPPLSWIVCNPDEVLPKLRRAYGNIRSRMALLAAVKALFKHIPGLKESRPECFVKWDKTFSKIAEVDKQNVMSAEPTDRERTNWVTWPEVLAAERALATSEYGSVNHLLLAMYCLVEPLRQNFGDVRLCRRDIGCKDKNFLVLTTGKLVLNDYKTSKKYGRFERQLPPELMNVIEASLRQHPRTHLFVNTRGEPYLKQNSFTWFSNSTLEKIFGKKFTVSLMRHSFISNLDFNAEVPAALFEKAKNMTHSLAQQQMYRRKVEPEGVQVLKL